MTRPAEEQDFRVFFLLKHLKDLGMVVHACNPSTETEGLRVQGQPGLHSKTLSQKVEEIRKKRKEGKETKTKANNKIHHLGMPIYIYSTEWTGRDRQVRKEPSTSLCPEEFTA